MIRSAIGTKERAPEGQSFPVQRPSRTVVSVSALENTGIFELAESLDQERTRMQTDGTLDALRRKQDQAWYAEAIEAELIRRIGSEERLRIARARLAELVAGGQLAPEEAATMYVDAVLRHPFE